MNVFSTLKASSILTNNDSSTEISIDRSKAVTPELRTNPTGDLKMIAKEGQMKRQKQMPRISKIIKE